MPLYFTSFMLPASAAIPYLMEDKYIRGGYRSVATVADRDAIVTGQRKAGMRVYCADTQKVYTLNPGALTVWVEVVSGKPVRETLSFTAGAPIAANGTLDFTLATGKTAIIQLLTASHASLKIEGFSTAARNDGNPYTFVSYAGHLSDDGSSKLQDNSLSYGRRYAIMANLEEPAVSTTYWRITNTGASAVTPTITVISLPLE